MPGVPPNLASLCLSCRVFSIKALNLHICELARETQARTCDEPRLEVSLSAINDPVRQFHPLPFTLSSVVAVDILPLRYGVAQEFSIPHVLFANYRDQDVEAIRQEWRALNVDFRSAFISRGSEDTYVVAISRHDLLHIAQQAEMPSVFAVHIQSLQRQPSQINIAATYRNPALPTLMTSSHSIILL